MGYIKKLNKLKRGPKKGHGLSSHPLYIVWKSMKSRCYCKTNIAWEIYGGNGVSVCPEWKDDFIAFYNWAINNGWKKGLEIDKDIKYKEKHGTVTGIIYSPEYCCFVTSEENNNNRSVTIFLNYNGENKSLSEWSKFLNLELKLLYDRIFKQKMPIELAFNKPIRASNRGKLFEINGEYRTLTEWCKFYNQPDVRVIARLRKGWSLIKSLTTKKNSTYTYPPDRYKKNKNTELKN